jgi:hypothetical protein
LERGANSGTVRGVGVGGGKNGRLALYDVEPSFIQTIARCGLGAKNHRDDFFRPEARFYATVSADGRREGQGINIRGKLMPRAHSFPMNFVARNAVFAALAMLASTAAGCIVGSSSSSHGGPTWEEPLKVSCRFTERHASGYGLSKSEDYNSRCVNSTCYGAGEPDGWVEIGDYWSNTSWSGFQEYHGSCEESDAQPVSCDGLQAEDACTACVLLNFCGSYLRATTDPNALWYLECINNCNDDSCIERCTETGEEMPYKSWEAIEELAATLADPWCADACGRS